MRLACLLHGHSPPVQAFFQHIRASQGREPSGVLKTVLYRPEHFGGALCALTQEIMRGESDWSVGERELFAAFTASLNRCAF